MKSLASWLLAAAVFCSLSVVCIGAAQDGPRGAQGEVLVSVLDENGAPMVGATVHLKPTQEMRDQGHWGNERYTAGRDGTVRLPVPVGELRTLSVTPARRGDEKLTRDVPPLLKGQTLDLEVVLRTRDDATFSAHVVDAETGAPVRGALVGLFGYQQRSMSGASFQERLSPPSSPLAVSDAVGLIQISAATWRPKGIGVIAEGYTPSLLTVGGEESAFGLGKEPWTIELVRPASIKLDVIDLPDDVVVIARTWDRAYYDLKAGMASRERLGQYCVYGERMPPVRGEVGDSEVTTVLLEGLPPNAAIDLEFLQENKVLRCSTELQTPEPGEQRRLTVDLFTGGSVEIVTLDRSGLPLRGVEVWIEDRDREERQHFEWNEKPIAKAITDGEGRASFDGLAIGNYAIAAGDPSRVPVPPKKWAFAGTQVEIEREQPVAKATLRAVTALTIEGSLRDHNNEPAEGLIVVSSEAANWKTRVLEATKAKFTLQGLLPGNYEITAHSRQVACSRLVRVKAGTTDVEISLRGRGRLSGRVVLGPDFQPAPMASAWLVDGASDRPMFPLQRRADGQFNLDFAPAGEHYVLASTRDGFITIQHLEIPADGELVDVDVILEQGAILEVHPRRTRYRTTVTVDTVGGGRIAHSAAPGEPVRLTVPAGTIDVVVRQPHAGTATKLQLKLRKGEVHREDVELGAIKKD